MKSHNCRALIGSSAFLTLGFFSFSVVVRLDTGKTPSWATVPAAVSLIARAVTGLVIPALERGIALTLVYSLAATSEAP